MIQIPLSRGRFAVIDECDAHLASFSWHCHSEGNGSSGFYAARNFYKEIGRGTMFLHHAVVGQPVNRSYRIDHINGNGLDNRRENLRVVSHRANMTNCKAHRQGKPAGFYWSNQKKKWIGQIVVGGKKKHLGYFDDQEKASRAYQVARQLLGESI